MSLSRRERSLLNDIARRLLEDDPQLAAHLGRPPRPKSSGWRLAGSLLLAAAGFLLLMLGAVLMSTALGAIGFLVMAAGASSASRFVDPPRFLQRRRRQYPGIPNNTSVE